MQSFFFSFLRTFLLFLLGSWLSSTLLQAKGLQEEDFSHHIVVASYNVDNYLVMGRRVDGVFRSRVGKPVAEKEAVVATIQEVNPDILGIMEMGSLRDAHDLEDRLDEVGLHYPYTKYLQGSDPVRHLLLLSRYPIREDHSEGKIPLFLEEKEIYSSRGILDVTLELPKKHSLRLIALHLKSKVRKGPANQEKIREAEASYVDQHVAAIESQNPNIPLLMMGDCNDTQDSPALQRLSDHMTPLSLHDSTGNTWTEYWHYRNIYSRIDYIFGNDALKPLLDVNHSGIERPPFWQQASDHCLVYTTLSV